MFESSFFNIFQNPLFLLGVSLAVPFGLYHLFKRKIRNSRYFKELENGKLKTLLSRGTIFVFAGVLVLSAILVSLVTGIGLQTFKGKGIFLSGEHFPSEKEAIVETLIKGKRAREEEIEALRAALAAAEKLEHPRKNEALDALKQGNTKKAEELFSIIVMEWEEKGEAFHIQAAQAAKHIGALALFSDTDRAIQAYQKAIELDPEDPEARWRLGGLYTRIGNYEKAISLLETIPTLDRAQSDKIWIGLAFKFIGDTFQTQDMFARAEPHYIQALEIFKQTENLSETIFTLNNLGLTHYGRRDLEKADYFYKKALELAEKNNLRKEKASTFRLLGLLSYRKGKVEEAENYLNTSLELQERFGDEHGMAENYLYLAFLDGSRGNLKEAIDSYEKALTFFEKLEFRERALNALNGLGAIHQLLGNLDLAETYYERGITVAEELDLKDQLPALYINLGALYHAKGDLTSAEILYRQGIKADLNWGQKVYVHTGYTSLGEVYQEKENYPLAKTYFLKGFETAKENNNERELALHLLNLGSIHIDLRQYSRSEEYFLEGLKIAKKFGRKEEISKVFDGLAQLYFKTENNEKACDYARKAFDLSNQIGLVNIISKNKIFLDENKCQKISVKAEQE